MIFHPIGLVIFFFGIIVRYPEFTGVTNLDLRRVELIRIQDYWLREMTKSASLQFCNVDCCQVCPLYIFLSVICTCTLQNRVQNYFLFCNELISLFICKLKFPFPSFILWLILTGQWWGKRSLARLGALTTKRIGGNAIICSWTNW